MGNDLTVLIPTWDRPENVNKRLHEINHLWAGIVDVSIQVNPGQYSAQDIDTALYNGPIEICENRENLGLCASVTCAADRIRTRWLWILGDDDSLKPDSREAVEQSLCIAEKENIDAILFNQWGNKLKDKELVICEDLPTFTDATDFTNPLFLSTTIWKTSFFQSRLGLFVEYSFSGASHALIYIATLHEKSSKALVMNRSLIDYVYYHRWSRISYLRHVFFLFRHPGVWQEKQVVMDFLWPQGRWALQSGLHEQVRSGDATLYEWIESAFEVTRFQFMCVDPATALQRTSEIITILLEAYPWQKLARIIYQRAWKTVATR